MPKSDKDRHLQLEFETILSFAQELRETPLGSGCFLPASETIADPHVRGTSKLVFSPDFTILDVEVHVSGDLSGDHSITLSHLHLDDASATGPLTVSLYPNDKAEVKLRKDRHFDLKIQLTNSDVIPRSNNNNFNTNTIASLYHAIRGYNLYVDVHGSGDYLLGMLRGQLYQK
jgi:hypothetical protein